MNIGPKTKQKLYLYIEKEHGWVSTRLVLVIVSGLLVLLRTPKSLNRIVREEIRGGDFKVPVRRLNWLLAYSIFDLQLFDDDFFDFSLGLDRNAAIDLLNRYNMYRETGRFKDHVHLAQLSSRVIESQLVPGQSIHIKDTISAQQYDQQYLQQLGLALENIRLVVDTVPVSKAKTKPKTDNRETVKSREAFSQNTLAQDVFCDAVDFMAIHQPKVYSVSGTLLGIIRENKLLSHDIDIDLGVMEEDIDVNRLVKAIQESSNFYIKKMDYPVLRNEVNGEIIYSRMSMPSLIKFGHKRGLHIDLFVHFKENSVRWHGSSLHRWNNSDFEIETVQFLGREIYIPASPERYLKENYGDWETPKIDFNCSIDTPNIALQNSCKTVCYFVKLLNFYRSDAEISNRIINLLGEQDITIPPSLRTEVAGDA